MYIYCINLCEGFFVYGLEEAVSCAVEQLQMLVESVKTSKYFVKKDGVGKFFVSSAGVKALADLQQRLQVYLNVQNQPSP